MPLETLFTGGHDTLFVYGLMYGADAEAPCPMCCSFLDALDGNAGHLAERIDLVVVARAPVERLAALAEARGWRSLRLLSSAGSRFPADYHLESPDGAQLPQLLLGRPHGVRGGAPEGLVGRSGGLADGRSGVHRLHLATLLAGP